MNIGKLLLVSALCHFSVNADAENIEGTFVPFKYGDFNQWITRSIKESGIIGGDTKTLYEIGPTQHINGNVAYTNKGGSPWATSNVYAKVSGITKTNNNLLIFIFYFLLGITFFFEVTVFFIVFCVFSFFSSAFFSPLSIPTSSTVKISAL